MNVTYISACSTQFDIQSVTVSNDHLSRYIFKSLSHILCFRSCTAITGLLEHNMANIRTTITKVLVLITGGAIMSYKAVKNKEIRQISP